MEIVIVSSLSVLMLLHLDLDIKLLVDIQNSLAYLLQVQDFEFIDEAYEKYAASDFIVLAVDVDSMVRTQGCEVVDRVDCDNEFVQWQIRIVFIAKVMYFSVLAMFQDLLLDGRVIFILADIPDLKLMISDVFLQFLNGRLFRIRYVIDIGSDL